MSSALNRILSRQSHAPQDDDAAERQSAQRRRRTWDELISSIGSRYATCRVENLEPIGDAQARNRQTEATKRLLMLSDNLAAHIRAGGNLLLYGPPGTGKDHLLVAMLRLAIREDFSALWVNGQDLYGDFRDRIDTDKSEASEIRRLSHPSILAISDPVPPKGDTSTFSTTMLYRIIDRRYRCLKSTWITANVAKADEARAELSAPIFDRLADNCVAVFCNWPSYRQSRKPAWMKSAGKDAP